MEWRTIAVVALVVVVLVSRSTLRGVWIRERGAILARDHVAGVR